MNYDPEAQRIRQAMVNAVDCGNIGVLRNYLDQGVDPNIRATDFTDGIAYGILSLAEEYSKSNACIKLLVERGLDTTDDHALYYLSKVIDCGNFELADFLLIKGTDINAPLRHGERMLTVAITQQFCWPRKVEYLVDRGANIEDSEFYDQRTPLMVAAQQHNRECILTLLLDKKANVNAQDFHGKTALIHAAEVGTPQSVQYLLARGADKTIVDRKGFDVLHYAKLRQRTRFVELLEEFQ